MKRYERTRILVEGDARIGRAMADDALAQMGEEAVSVVEGPRECLVMVQVRETVNSMGPLYTQDVADIKGALAQIWQLQRYILSSQR